MKELKDYLHLYLGCEMLCVGDGTGDYEYKGRKVLLTATRLSMSSEKYFNNAMWKPILRPLSDITDKEVYECEDYMWESFPDAMTCDKDEFLKMFIECTPEYRPGFSVYVRAINWFRKNGFDVDELIESGLAIETNHLPKVSP